MTDAMLPIEPGAPGSSVDAGPPGLEPPPSKWPTVLGVISLIYALGGLLCQFAAVGSMFFMETLMRMGGMTVTTPVQVKVVGITEAFLAFVVGILMLIGSARLLRRRRSGPSWLRAWVMIRLILVALTFALTFVNAPANLEFQRSMTEAANQKMIDGGRSGMVEPIDETAMWNKLVRTAIIMSVMFSAYPLFLGFWLTRRKVKDQVEQWE